MDPEMMEAGAPPMLAPEDPNAMPGLDVPEGFDPGEVASLVAGQIRGEFEMGMQMLTARRDAQVEAVVTMIMQESMGSSTLDGMAVAA